MICGFDPSANGFLAYGLFDLCSEVDLSARLHADKKYIQIAGETPYKKFETARRRLWLKYGEPLFMRLYQDRLSGKWNYHILFPFYTSNRHKKEKTAVEMTFQEAAVIIEGGRELLEKMFKGEWKP